MGECEIKMQGSLVIEIPEEEQGAEEGGLVPVIWRKKPRATRRERRKPRLALIESRDLRDGQIRLHVPVMVQTAYLHLVLRRKEGLATYLSKKAGGQGRALARRELVDQVNAHFWHESGQWIKDAGLECLVRLIRRKDGRSFFLTVHPGRETIDGIYTPVEFHAMKRRLSRRRRKTVRVRQDLRLAQVCRWQACG